MEANYAILLALCVVISDAKVFIGDCAYGFCEQNCKQIKEFEMECFCKRGFTLKTDGRKCLKTFVTDDEFSGDATSGDGGNCDNEDGNCDKTGIETVISGDGEEGSGDLLSSIIQALRPVKSSHVAKVSILPVTTKSKTLLDKTIDVPIRFSVAFTKISTTPLVDKTPTAVSEIVQLKTPEKVYVVSKEIAITSTDILRTNVIKRIPTKTKLVTQEIISSTIGKVDFITKSTEILFKKSITPSSVLTSISKSSFVSFPLPSLSFSKKFDEKVVDGTPLPVRSIVQGSESRSIYKIHPVSMKEKVSVSSSASLSTSNITYQKRKESKPDGLMSTIYKRIQIVYQQETIRNEDLFITTSTNTHTLLSTSVIPSPTKDPRIIVIQDDEHVMPDQPIEYTRRKSADVLDGETFPDVTVALPSDPFSKVHIIPSYKKDGDTKERDTVLITPDVRVQTDVSRTEVFRSVRPAIPIDIDMVLKSSRDSRSSTLIKLPFYRTKVYKINATVRTTFPRKSIHKLKETVQGSITTIRPRSSFISISVSSEIIKKTTPLDVFKTHTVTKSTFLGLPMRKPSSVTDKFVSKTVSRIDGRDLISTPSIKSSSASLFILEKKTTEVEADKMLSSRILPTTSRIRSTSSGIPPTPTKEIKRIVVIADKSESHAHTLLVNTYLLTFGMCFTICFLVVY